MRKFWSDYYELCKQSCKFCKDHWFGLIVTNIVAAIGTTIYVAKRWKIFRF